MAHQQQSNNILDAVQLLADHGFDEMSQALQILFNEADEAGTFPNTSVPNRINAA
ncbi:hypothetical protein Enr10x_55770 [Gimesia panareensis]|uniref:Uncharacterized protein n=1 Tax=Gimesia panareensis TaxID=2527978 RepID=A0A517Q5N4_9PLAN|nr:hypothetical protein [Gimesia panareensis]QDT25114.1 hypothetical protein Enr10x_04080 [Gimesia panareensis]QDT25483.1 hypothetical protein Enr10x_07790 [Gimesia panareensis]QDT26906.1 hypothetical protein Enr10x_22180 [Gimesia panareensis]QDT27304.1 hypothetical protein Enr10x_26210 [Gimesia panareensis]QDT30217.1 hypothetical protein Enr10x_55770 [Gimesia panareensis]